MPSVNGFRWRFPLLLIFVVAAVAFLVWNRTQPGGNTPPPGESTQPVRVAVATFKDVPEYLNGLGTVIPANTALVRSRVDGLLERVFFTEGQMVKEGDVLAAIDPKPFEVALSQARGLLSRDLAILENARRDLERYARLGKSGGMSVQEVDTQRALVRQYEGIVKNNQAQVDAAKLQLDYTRITAPISGRLGLREVDEGNMIRASDTTGIVRITQTDPIYVVFTVPESQVQLVLEALSHQEPLEVQAWDREQKQLIVTGTLLTVDNQIDSTTGTIKLKARFTNATNVLFPNQFVHARLLVRTLHHVVTVPASAVQLGARGSLVYVVDAENRVKSRAVTLGWKTDTLDVIDSGITAGETVVIDGLDRLRDGTKVEVINESSKGGDPAPSPFS